MLINLLVAVADPGQGVPPPGSQKLLLILQWAAWSVFGLCVAGVLVSAVKLAHAHRSGGFGGQEQSTLAWVLVACVVAGSASGIVGALA